MQLLAEADTVPLNDTDFAMAAATALTGTGTTAIPSTTTTAATDVLTVTETAGAGGRSSPSPAQLTTTPSATRARGISFAPTAAVVRAPLNSESSAFARARGLSVAPPLTSASASTAVSPNDVDIDAGRSSAGRPLKSALKKTSTTHRRLSSSLRFETSSDEHSSPGDAQRPNAVQDALPIMAAPLRSLSVLRDLPADDPSLSIRDVLRRGVSIVDDAEPERDMHTRSADGHSPEVRVQVHAPAMPSAATLGDPNAYSQFD
jgi:hypothetical protein